MQAQVSEQDSHQQPPSSEEEESNIAKAIRLWKHPSLRDIPMEQKRAFLQGKGVTDAQIHQAWDRIMEEGDPLIESSATKPPQPQNASHTIQPTTQPAPATSLPPTTNPYSSNSPYTFPPTNDPYYRSQQYGPPFYDDEDGHGPFVQGASLVALGGLFGLTAAAAFRWLNGGEFQILPPPSLPEGQVQGQRLIPQDPVVEEEDTDEEDQVDEEHEEDGDDDEEELVLPEVQEKMLRQAELISESMRAHVTVQEKILQKLTNQGSAFTNQSMDLLRSSNPSNDKSNGKNANPSDAMQIWSQLVEVKAELRSLVQFQALVNTSKDARQPWEDQLASALSRLETCIDSVESSFGNRQQKTNPTSSADVPTSNAKVAAPTSALTGTAEIVSKQTPSDAAKNVTEELTTAPQQVVYTLRQAIRKIAEENDATTLRVGTQLLYLYMVNLSGNPENPRYRKIFTTTDSFKKVEALAGGKDLLLAVGFEENEGGLEWLASNPSPEKEGLATIKLQQATAALGILKSGKPSAETTTAALEAVPPDPDVELKVPVNAKDTVTLSETTSEAPTATKSQGE